MVEINPLSKIWSTCDGHYDGCLDGGRDGGHDSEHDLDIIDDEHMQVRWLK